jgi:hypothetical protein
MNISNECILVIIILIFIYFSYQINSLKNNKENFDTPDPNTIAIANLNNLASNILNKNALTIPTNTTISGSLTYGSDKNVTFNNISTKVPMNVSYFNFYIGGMDTNNVTIPWAQIGSAGTLYVSSMMPQNVYSNYVVIVTQPRGGNKGCTNIVSQANNYDKLNGNTATMVLSFTQDTNYVYITYSSVNTNDYRWIMGHIVGSMG